MIIREDWPCGCWDRYNAEVFDGLGYYCRAFLRPQLPRNCQRPIANDPEVS